VKPTILVIDDDSEIRYSLNRVLASKGYAILSAASGEEGIEVAERSQPHVILLDNRMGGISGIETLQHIRSASPSSMVILMTAYGTTQTAIEAMKFGAFDYIIKPFSPQKILQIIENASKARADLEEAGGKTPSRKIDPDDLKEGIVGQSESMQEVFKMIGQVAASDATVLVTGESGTGKELVARAIYRHSHRSGGAYLAVNCAAIPENLIESELFGHEKGAFTGATNTRQGKFELCDGGTIFLDEIGDMTLSTQTKILRAIQEGEIQRVGGSKTIKIDVRVIAATNKDLSGMMKDGGFREDLFYRLSVVRLRLPSLKERLEDIPDLVGFMLQKLAKDETVKARKVSSDAMALLDAHDWPGNVRELENLIYRSAVVAKGDTILVKDFPSEFVADPVSAASSPPAEPPIETTPESSHPLAQPPATLTETSLPGALGDSRTLSHSMTIEEAFDLVYAKIRDDMPDTILGTMEKEMVRRALRETGGNQVKASSLLGITRATLRKRIEQYSIRF
jgi:DNA-binding NtrC family response regulator